MDKGRTVFKAICEIVKTLLAKQVTFLFEAWPDSAKKGDIL